MRSTVLLGIFVFFAINKGEAQSNHNAEGWLGYISSVRIHDKFSLWNDFHIVPNSFFVARTGVTYDVLPNVRITGGYAWVSTATAFSNKLMRKEHRPWAQMESVFSVKSKSFLRARIRYDARFRQRVAGFEVHDEYGLYHRLRFMVSYVVMLKQFRNESKLQLNVMNETLLNLGAQSGLRTLDQNRTFLLAGLATRNITYQLGYHLRVIPSVNAAYRFNHGITLWIIQSFDIRSKKKRDIREYISPHEGG